MKTYDIDCYVVECPDGGGMYNIRVGLFSTKEVADEYAKLKEKVGHILSKNIKSLLLCLIPFKMSKHIQKKSSSNLLWLN